MRRPSMPGTMAAAAVLVLAGAAGCGGGTVADDGPGGRPETVTVQLDYRLRGNHGIFYVADRLGYFRQEGIKVADIKQGTGSTDAVRIVGNGRAQFGFADLPTLVTARSHGVPVKALAVVNQSSPLAMCSLKARVRLGKAADLKGLTVGIHPAGSTFIFYKALLAANGVDRKAIKQASVTPPYENYLMRKKVDAVPCYIDAEVPLLQKAAGGPDKLSVMLGSDAGYKVYGSGLIASDEMIKKHPGVVQRFTNAYLRAFSYVEQHPEETARILAATSPENALKSPVFLRQLQADISHSFNSEATRARGLGAMEETRWQDVIGTLAKQKVLTGRPLATKDVYDQAFVDAYNAKNR
ncbi:ABC transporter substrate-binding protein [Spirillospora sp. CA-108201]